MEPSSSGKKLSKIYLERRLKSGSFFNAIIKKASKNYIFLQEFQINIRQSKNNFLKTSKFSFFLLCPDIL